MYGFGVIFGGFLPYPFCRVSVAVRGGLLPSAAPRLIPTQHLVDIPLDGLKLFDTLFLPPVYVITLVILDYDLFQPGL